MPLRASSDPRGARCGRRKSRKLLRKRGVPIPNHYSLTKPSANPENGTVSGGVFPRDDILTHCCRQEGKWKMVPLVIQRRCCMPSATVVEIHNTLSVTADEPTSHVRRTNQRELPIGDDAQSQHRRPINNHVGYLLFTRADLGGLSPRAEMGDFS